jgi:hypothetical protein
LERAAAPKSWHSLDFWLPEERKAFLDHECEHTVTEPVKTKNPSEGRRFLAPQIGGGFGTVICATARKLGLRPRSPGTNTYLGRTDVWRGEIADLYVALMIDDLANAATVAGSGSPNRATRVRTKLSAGYAPAVLPADCLA